VRLKFCFRSSRFQLFWYILDCMKPNSLELKYSFQVGFRFSKLDCFPSLSMRCSSMRSSFSGVRIRSAPFLVLALSSCPSNSIPKNFRGFNHVPSFFTHPDFASFISIPLSGIIASLSNLSTSPFPYTNPSSAYWIIGLSLIILFRGSMARSGDVGAPCATPLNTVRLLSLIY